MKVTHAFAGIACLLGLAGTATAQWGNTPAYSTMPTNVSPAQYSPAAYVPQGTYQPVAATAPLNSGFAPGTTPSYAPAPAGYRVANQPTMAPPPGSLPTPTNMRYPLPTPPQGTPNYSVPSNSAPSYATPNYTVPNNGNVPLPGTPSYAPTTLPPNSYADQGYAPTPNYGAAPSYGAGPGYGATPYSGGMPPSYSPGPMNGAPTPTPLAPWQQPNQYTSPVPPPDIAPVGPGTGPTPYSSPYDAALTGDGFCDDACGAAGTCGGDGCGGCGRKGAWFGSLAGLLMTRDRPAGFRTSGLTTNPNQDILDTSDARIDWVGGYEARVGRSFGEQYAVEGTYWSLARAEDNFSAYSATNQLQSTLTFGGLSAGGTPLGTLFNNAAQHQVFRNDEIHNIEINVLRQVVPMCATRFGMTAIAGARYFRFDEGVTFASAASGTTIGDTATSGYYDVDTVNDLIGGQIGGRMHYYMGKFRLYAIPKVGVYCNAIRTQSQIYRGDGPSAFNIANYKNDVSMIGQIDFGGSWQITQRLSAFMAYRGMGVTGLALSDNQFVNDVSNTPAIQRVDSNGSLILHGLVAGGQISF